MPHLLVFTSCRLDRRALSRTSSFGGVFRVLTGVIKPWCSVSFDYKIDKHTRRICFRHRLPAALHLDVQSFEMSSCICSSCTSS
jgi:hypothetical protein